MNKFYTPEIVAMACNFTASRWKEENETLTLHALKAHYVEISMKKNKISQPWMNHKNQLKSNKEILEICPHWSTGQWEGYLSSTDGKRTESLMEDAHFTENTSQEDYKSVLPSASKEKNLKLLKETLGEILKQLSDNQRQVIHCLFWENLSFGEISKELGVSRVAILQTKDRALKKISKLLLKEVSRRNGSFEEVKTKKQCLKSKSKNSYSNTDPMVAS